MAVSILISTHQTVRCKQSPIFQRLFHFRLTEHPAAPHNEANRSGFPSELFHRETTDTQQKLT